jgi:hypothetical protein
MTKTAKKVVRKSKGILSAKKLGIQPFEREGLIRFVKKAKAGRLKTGAEAKQSKAGSVRVFNLNIGAFKDYGGPIEYRCGTIACIGGWAAILMGMSVDKASHYVAYNSDGNVDFGEFYDEKERQQREKWKRHSPVLYELYYPHSLPEDYGWEHLHPLEAAEVVQHFLETGKINYSLVVPGTPDRSQ